MGSLNSRQLKIARFICINRDGAFCIDCKIPITVLEERGEKIHVDHKDGNNHNNPSNGSNWQLLCHSCNVVKWHKQKYQLALTQGEDAFMLIVSSRMEYQWVKWLYASIIKYGKVTKNFAIKTGALEVNGNPVTTGRYLGKHLDQMEFEGQKVVSDKAIFREVKIDFDVFIKLSKKQEELRDENKGFE